MVEAEFQRIERALKRIMFLQESFKKAKRIKAFQRLPVERAVNFKAIVPHMSLRNAALTANSGKNKAQAPWLKPPFLSNPQRKV